MSGCADLQKLRNGDKLFSAAPSASPSTYSPSMPLRAFLPHMPPMMRASTWKVQVQVRHALATFPAMS